MTTKHIDILPCAAHDAASQTDQIIAVRCMGGSNALLSYFKKDPAGAWVHQFTCDAFIGKSGAGKQREGDMKTPLGTFDLSTPFGILKDPSAQDSKGQRIENYIQFNEHHYWCGQNGPHYNRLIDSSAPPKGYSPSPDDEHMIDYRPSYHYGMVIGYNPKCIPHLGSAIFLHCFGRKPYTAGCVSVSEEIMRELVLDVHSGAKIVIFQ